MPKWPPAPKPYSEKMTTEEVWTYFEKANMAHLATVDGDRPRVRAMALIKYEKKLFMLTHTKWDKVRQIAANDKVEFTAGVHGEKGVGMLRTTAKAIIVEDLDTKQMIANAVPWFSEYWGSHEDLYFTLIQLEPVTVLFDHPDNGLKYTIDF
ncbi:MAG: pyridoxamine 5'-phosphate oxidase family protein [Candidatus Thorarchaeota archaeon]